MPADAVPSAPGAQPAPVSVDSAHPAALPQIDIDRLPDWSRSPFAHIRPYVAPEVVTAAAETVPAAPPVDPVIGSILYAADRQLAMIEGRLVRVGDKIGDATVVEIRADAVVIDGPPAGRRTLSVRQSRVGR
jgi:hypothetical protein